MQSLVSNTVRQYRPVAVAFVHDTRIGRLATIDAGNRPAVIPSCFAMLGDDDNPVVVSMNRDSVARCAAKA